MPKEPKPTEETQAARAIRSATTEHIMERELRNGPYGAGASSEASASIGYNVPWSL